MKINCSALNMGILLRIMFFLSCTTFAAFTEPSSSSAGAEGAGGAGCVIELECAECVPDNMPLVTSHRAAGGVVALAAGDEVRLACGAGRLLAAPGRASVAAVCEAGRFRLRHDGRLLHLLDLGCQEDIFEDVLHHVEYCAPPLQGRAYKMTEDESGGGRHLATLCFDEDRGIATFAHVTNAAGNVLRMPPHEDRSGPLSLLGNFNHMFDANTRQAAEKLYSDETRLNRRLLEILKHDHVSLGEQTLTTARLLSERYFEDQNMRVADFVSNKVLAWRSVASGNLRHLQTDVARLLRQTRPHGALHVYAGTHGEGTVRTGGPAGPGGPSGTGGPGVGGRATLRLRGGRFPVARYVWTVVVDAQRRRALAVAVLNDPLVAVSEIRESVFCESVCARVAWLRETRRARRFETPLLGLAFCCHVHNFTALVPELPAAAVADVPHGDEGLLTELFT